MSQVDNCNITNIPAAVCDRTF